MSAAATRRAARLPLVGAVPPVAVAVRVPVRDLTAEQLLAPEATLAVAVTPLLRDALAHLGAQQLSTTTFLLRDVCGDDPRLHKLATLIPASAWAPASAASAARAAGALRHLDPDDLHQAAARELGVALPARTAATIPAGRVLVRRSGRRVTLRVAADSLVVAGVDLSTVCRPARRPVKVLPHVALLAVDDALRQGLLVVDADGHGQVTDLRRALRDAIVVLPAQTGPGVADVVETPSSTGRRGSRMRVRRASAVDAVATRARVRAVHPEVDDVAAMAAAQPTAELAPDGLRLRDYQQRAAALHGATSRGYVNLGAPGLGKTVMALVGMRGRALATSRWRGLVACPAAVRDQWASEAGRWFPEAHVHVVRTRADIDGLSAALRVDGHVLAVVSHELLPAAGGVLLRARFDDLVCDEALLLRNATSVRGRLLWQLRGRCGVAVALTGSPPGEKLSGVTALAAWCRNRPELLAAPEPTSAQELAQLLGPVLFRQDQRALDGEVDVTPTEVTAVVADERETTVGSAALQRATEAVRAWAQAPASRAARLRPAAVTALNAARAALSDPCAGVGPGAKRAVLVSLAAQCHVRGERVLVFTDFTTSARAALTDLAAAEVPAGGLLGGQSARARQRAVSAFVDGSVPVLVVTPAGQEGLNLQVADVVVHLDVPFEVAPLLQRQSRARRIGGTGTVRSIALVTAGLEETAARQVFDELTAELAGRGRLEGGAATSGALTRAARLLAA